MRFPTLPLILALSALSTGPALAADHAHHGKPVEHRKAIKLNAEEKAHIHMEMRLFLSTVQKIVTAAAADDLKTVGEAAREAGMAAAHEVPGKLREKLPMEFRKMGHATHQGFDDLARDAESLGDANHALKQLGSVMSNCVSCHAVYRIETGKH